jgi:hypothetical protein
MLNKEMPAVADHDFWIRRFSETLKFRFDLRFIENCWLRGFE